MSAPTSSVAPVLRLLPLDATPATRPRQPRSSSAIRTAEEAARVLTVAARIPAASPALRATLTAAVADHIERLTAHPTAAGLWNAASALRSAELALAETPSEPLERARASAAEALACLRAVALFPLGRPVVEALTLHAGQGGTPAIRDLIEWASGFRRLCQRVEIARQTGSGTEGLDPELGALIESFRRLPAPDPVPSPADMLGLQAALEIMDLGTDSLYRSADAELEQAREARRGPLPPGTELVDELFLVDVDELKLTRAAERLIQLVTDHPMLAELNGVRMIALPEDKLLPTPAAVVLERYLDLHQALGALEAPNVPDDALHNLRAELAVTLEVRRVQREIVEIQGVEPRSAERLCEELGTLDMAARGRRILRHAVEIERWVGVMIEDWVRWNAPPTMTLAEAQRIALEAIGLWLEVPGYALFDATLPLWKRAVAVWQDRLAE